MYNCSIFLPYKQRENRSTYLSGSKQVSKEGY